MRVFIIAVGVAWLIFLTGCAPKLPPIIPTEGIVTVEGKPLANVAVTFIPLLDRFGAETNSTAVTDDQGRFTLTCAFNNTPGAVACEHIVLVEEAPLPDKLRGITDGNVIDRHYAKLGNRPIPQKYSSLSQSPLRITVKAGQGPIPLELTR